MQAPTSVDDIKPDTTPTKDALATLKQRKSVLMRHVNSLDRAIEEELEDDVRDRLPRLRSTFAEMENIIDEYSGEIPDWFDDAQSLYFEAASRANQWLKSRASSSDSSAKKSNSSEGLEASNQEREVHKLGLDIAQMLSVPKIEIEPFDGNPMNYHSFCRSFKVNVEQVCSDPDAKLAHLLSCTTGPAHDAIKGTRITGGKEGYERAQAILAEMFGSRQIIVQEVMNELNHYSKALKTAQQVRDYSFALSNAREILTALGALSELDSQTVIKGLVANLPIFAQHKWCDKQLKSRRKSDRYLCFTELVDFVISIADGMNDPVCGQAARTQRNAPKAKADNQRVQNFAVADPSKGASVAKLKKKPKDNAPRASERGRSMTSQCALCGESHPLSRCSKFRDMDVTERRHYIDNQNACLNCLRVGHSVEQCLSDNRCLICKAKHSVFLHIDGITANVASHVDRCYMPVVRVLVNGEKWANAALDSCSSATFCTKAFASTLTKADGEVQYSNLETLLGRETVATKFITCELSRGSEKTTISGVRLVERIPVTCGTINKSQYPHLQGIELSADTNLNEVDLLIGQDCADALIPLSVRKGNPGEPFAVLYKFGWALNGSNFRQAVSNTVICNFVSRSMSEMGDDRPGALPGEELHQDLSKLWALERSDDNEMGFSIDEQRVIDLWDCTCIKDKDGHFVLPIPWRNPDEELPNNLHVAKRRLDLLLSRLASEKLYEKYNAEIDKLLTDGYAEIVPDSESEGDDASERSRRVWYLPHHHVLNPNKPDKLRVVFDCASRFKGRSLNERCFQGPNLINPLLGVLLRFREHDLAIQADVKAMYNQVRIPEHDRDALRFLWVRDGRLIHLRMIAHLFGGIWCSAVSSYALRKTVESDSLIHPLVRQVVMKSMYVDDCLASVATYDDAIVVLNELPKVLQSGGFTLTKFVVNDETLIAGIPLEHRAKELHSFPDSTGKALGVKWDVGKDSFCYDVAKPLAQPLSRRSMLKFVASIFDPLGLVSPWVIWGRILFQSATKLKLDWDDEVPESIANDWESWRQSLNAASSTQFPRCIRPRSFDGYAELHIFCDASFSAFGACAYVRCITPSGQMTSSLLMAKCHVAPVKAMTMPRLELQAACIASEMAHRVVREMDLYAVPIYFWSDSQVVLGYITNQKRRFRLFVSNRVRKIRALSAPERWRYVSTQDNPADLLTRPQTNTVDTKIWTTGPQWLCEANAFWMRQAADHYSVEDDDPEVTVSTVGMMTQSNAPVVDRLIARHSCWRALCRNVAWLRRFCDYIKNKEISPKGNLTAEELTGAQNSICKYVQRMHYPADQVKILKSSPIFSLRPFFDREGLLRVGGRTQHHPIILPHDHVVSQLLARHFHEKSHSGVEWSLSLLRQAFWITKGRRLMTRIVHACVTCKKLRAHPAQQLMADLPPERVATNLPPFSHVGIDAFGPYHVAYKRQTVKRYGCIFTCLVCRAVHLEVLESLDVDSFLNAFRRFIARRGTPIKVFSDNGTNFVAGERELREAFIRYSKNELQRYGAENGIAWSFIPPSAPHMGGAWERLIGVVKNVLRGVLGRASRLTDEILTTALCEAEAIVNGRPLTKLSDDPNDLTPLTPSQLLYLKGPNSLPPGVSSVDSYRHRWKFVQHLANQFWTRFLREYVPELNKRCKWATSHDNLKAGELVLVVEPNVPRGVWPLAIVQKTFAGSDGKVRSAVVRTKTGELTRPIVKLVRLEVH